MNSSIINLRPLTGTVKRIENSGDSAVIVSTSEKEKDDEIIRKLINRERYFEAVITKKSGSFSIELMKEVLRCTDEGVEVCNEKSNWATILLPKQFEMLVADRFPCYNDFKRFGEI
jgi:hypothetical protein